MHQEAFDWVALALEDLSRPPQSVLEIGSRSINGSVRGLFSGAKYLGIDICEGPGVDLVADGATFTWDGEFDVVVCTEVLEHTRAAEEICRNAVKLTRRGGLFIATCAGPARAPHSAIDGGPLREGEYYGNLERWQLDLWCDGFVWVESCYGRGRQDVYLKASNRGSW
jgi:hypothetical protein